MIERALQEAQAKRQWRHGMKGTRMKGTRMNTNRGDKYSTISQSSLKATKI